MEDMQDKKVTANQSIPVPGNKCWVYPSPVSLTTNSDKTEAHLNQFFTKWESHGTDVNTGCWHIAFDHFLIISVNEQQVHLSGCSMDSMRHSVIDLGKLLDIDFLNRLIYYVDAKGNVQSADRPGFKELILTALILPNFAIP